MLGELELKNEDWVKAKETFQATSDTTDGKDSYATLSLVHRLFTVHAFIVIRFRCITSLDILFVKYVVEYIRERKKEREKRASRSI